MTDRKKFENESQDARRHDQKNAVHPDEKSGKNRDKPEHNHDKHSSHTKK